MDRLCIDNYLEEGGFIPEELEKQVFLNRWEYLVMDLELELVKLAEYNRIRGRKKNSGRIS